jgi:hypothetical protein
MSQEAMPQIIPGEAPEKKEAKTSGQSILDAVERSRDLFGSPIKPLNDEEVRTLLAQKGGDFLNRYDRYVLENSAPRAGNAHSGSVAGVERVLIEAGVIPGERTDLDGPKGAFE